MNPRVSRAALNGAALLLTVLLCACSTPSINAIYSDDQNEVVKDDRVVGLWVPDDSDKDKSRYRVTAIGRPEDAGKAPQPGAQPAPVYYRLTIENDSGKSEKMGDFDLRVVRLGATDFIDLFPTDSESRSLSERYGMAALPMHVIMPVTIKDDRATVRPLDISKVRELLAAVPGMTPHAVRDNDHVILTGSTRQVQEFFRKVVGDDAVFDKPIELKRAPEPAAAPKPATTPTEKKAPPPTKRK